MKLGFERFVAWRYLQRDNRRPGLITMGIGLALVASCAALLLLKASQGGDELVAVTRRDGFPLEIIAFINGGIGALVILFGAYLSFMSIFTTIATFGVFLGTASLVIVLSVMNGFEADLRRKILGSNAHVQVSRENGAFTNWREIQSRVGGVCVDGACVVGTMPYLTSEVLVSANSNFGTVVIKGIDPVSALTVTDLARNLGNPAALGRLWPLGEDGSPRPYTLSDVTTTLDDGEPVDFSGGTGEPPPPRDPARGAPPPDDGPRDDDEPVDFSSGGAAAADHDAATTDDDDDGFGPAPLDPRVRALDGVLVGRELAKNLYLYTGQEVQLVSPIEKVGPTGGSIPRVKSARVAGVFFSGMYEYDNRLVYVTLPALQRFLDLGDEVEGIEVKISNPDRSVEVAAALQAQLGPEVSVRDWRELNRNLFSALKLEKIAMFLALSLIVLVASFCIVCILIMLVIEKARQIAMLKSIGASDVSVLLVFMCQGLYIGLLGGVTGVAVGVLCCWALATHGLPLDPNVYYIDRLPVDMEPLPICLAAIAAALICILATLYPSWMAARLRPVDGLKK